jgi:hypothetical protein
VAEVVPPQAMSRTMVPTMRRLPKRFARTRLISLRLPSRTGRAHPARLSRLAGLLADLQVVLHIAYARDLIGIILAHRLAYRDCTALLRVTIR